MKKKLAIEIYTHPTRQYTVRDEILDGQRHLVVPVVMMVEGVHSGSAGPLYHPIEELGRFPSAWDGTPVVINHPADSEGTPLSANSPSLIQGIIGRVYNTHVQGSRLRGEIWANESRLLAVAPELIEYLRDGQGIEVSVGVYTEDDEEEGEWNGEHYIATARNHRPDHLALLPTDEGACSWRDGCGIRNNKKESDMKRSTKPKTSASITVHNGDKELEEGKDYTIEGQVLTFASTPPAGTTVTEEKVHEWKYRGTLHVNAGYMQIGHNIQRKLNGMDTDVKTYYLEDVYDDYFIYRVHTMERGGEEPKYFRKNYTVEGESVVLAEEEQEVRKNVSYDVIQQNQKSVTNNQTNNQMKKCEKVKALISNASTQFTEDDREWLESLEEAQLDKMIPTENKEAPLETNKKEEGKETSSQVNVQDEIKKVFATYKDKPEDFINELLPADMAEEMRSGLKLHKAKREGLVKGIVANSDFSEEDLASESLERLEKLHNAVVRDEVDYSAAHGTTSYGAMDEASENELTVMMGFDREDEATQN